MEDNFFLVFCKFIRLIDVKVTTSTIERYLSLHPDGHSLLCYSDALNEWNVENAVVAVQQDKFLELPTPHIAFLDQAGLQFTVVKKVTEDLVYRYEPQRGNITQGHQEYLKEWGGVVLLAEPDEKSGERNYSANRKVEFLKNCRIPFASVCFGIAFISLLTLGVSEFGKLASLILALNVLALTLCVLLLNQVISTTSSFLHKLCGLGRQINCHSVLESKASKITSWLTWSEVGFIFFATATIAQLVSYIMPADKDSFLSVYSTSVACSFPLTLYLVYYQARIARMWCLQCLVVTSILWVEFVVLLFTFDSSTFAIDFQLKSYALWLFSFASPVGVWILLKQNLVQSTEGLKSLVELKRLKNDPQLFLTLLTKQTRMPEVPSSLGAIVLGESQAPHVLTMVASLTCSPCSKIFMQIDKLVSHTKLIKCQVVFVISPGDSSVGEFVAGKLLRLESGEQRHALRLWYGRNDKNVEQWDKETGQANSGSLGNLEMQQEWVFNARIDRTPTLFYDGYALPELYSISDLEDLVKISSSMVEDSLNPKPDSNQREISSQFRYQTSSTEHVHVV